MSARVTAFIVCVLVLMASATAQAIPIYSLSAIPSSSPLVGDQVTITLTGGLSNIALLDEKVSFPSALLQPEFSLDCNADATGLLGSGLAGTANAFAVVCPSPGGFDFTAVAVDVFSTASNDAAILSFPFKTLGSGQATLTFKTCAADPLQDCDAGNTAINSLTLNIQQTAVVPEPSSLGLLAAVVLAGFALRRASSARIAISQRASATSATRYR